ncbi:hypothetical protein SCG7109_AK_00060 [Chlamydiales bacterium SCGC AG-110-M15]|nr:hypothetical protein SCG7109_AK_00060 [Chlamydiales bacterium SCGC AG-110-M15]
MQIVIEDNTIEWKLTKENVLLKTIVEEVETFLLTVGRVPIALTIDGESLTQEDLDKRQDTQMKGDEVLEFGVMTLTDFVLENLEGASNANDDLLGKINRFADELYSSTKTVDPQEMVGGLRDFFFFWARMNTLFPQIFIEVQLGDHVLSEHIEQLQEIFKEIISAMEEEDTVLAADLLQYEVAPIIEIVGKGIPSMKNQINSLYDDEAKAADKNQESKENV